MGKYTMKLFIGIPIVWLPTVLVFQLLTKDSNQKGSWKRCMRECPKWMKRMSSVFVIYAFISFGILLFGMYHDIKSDGSDRGLPNFISLGVSGFCLVFYSTAMAMLFRQGRYLRKKIRGIVLHVINESCNLCSLFCGSLRLAFPCLWAGGMVRP